MKRYLQRIYKKLIFENVMDTPETIIDYSQLTIKNCQYLSKLNSFNATYCDLHDDDDIKPQNLTDDQKISLYHFSSKTSEQVVGSSKNLNGYLRNRVAGNDTLNRLKKNGFITKKSNSKIKVDVTEYKVKIAVELLASCFTPENTIKKKIDTFCGVPPSIGKSLSLSRLHTITNLHSFTSTSTSYLIGRDFARKYSFKNKRYYIIHFICDPGSGISIVHHSEFSENEILLKFGTKVEFLDIHSNQDGEKIRVVLVFKVYPVKDALDLESYGTYHHPENL